MTKTSSSSSQPESAAVATTAPPFDLLEQRKTLMAEAVELQTRIDRWRKRAWFYFVGMLVSTVLAWAGGTMLQAADRYVREAVAAVDTPGDRLRVRTDAENVVDTEQVIGRVASSVGLVGSALFTAALLVILMKLFVQLMPTLARRQDEVQLAILASLDERVNSLQGEVMALRKAKAP